MLLESQIAFMESTSVGLRGTTKTISLLQETTAIPAAVFVFEMNFQKNSQFKLVFVISFLVLNIIVLYWRKLLTAGKRHDKTYYITDLYCQRDHWQLVWCCKHAHSYGLKIDANKTKILTMCGSQSTVCLSTAQIEQITISNISWVAAGKTENSFKSRSIQQAIAVFV